MAFVVYSTFRSAGPYCRNGINRSQARSHTATAAGYFFPSGVPEKSASAAMEAREELLEETAANNEGMPEAEGGEGRKAVAAGE